MIAWIVYRGYRRRSCVITTVFYTANCDAEYVRESLINHDGYPSNIIVERE